MNRNAVNGHGGRSAHTATQRRKGQGVRPARAATPGDHEEVAALLPLTEPMFHILLALSDRELHGYGIIISVAKATRGGLRLRTGTLYTAIRRMVDDGLIREAASVADAGDDSRRRYYRLTRFGRAVARAEAHRVSALASIARSRGLLKSDRARVH